MSVIGQDVCDIHLSPIQSLTNMCHAQPHSILNKNVWMAPSSSVSVSVIGQDVCDIHQKRYKVLYWWRFVPRRAQLLVVFERCNRSYRQLCPGVCVYKHENPSNP